MSHSPGLVDFAIGLVISVINLSDRQVSFFEEFKLQKNREINLLIKTFCGQVEISYSELLEEKCSVTLKIVMFWLSRALLHTVIYFSFVGSCFTSVSQ